MTGMLWLDNSKDPLAKKIERAVAYYQNKYAKTVRTVIIHPQDAEDCTIPGISIHPSRECQRHHLLVSEETVGS
jgi:hypothetical protein